MLMSQLVNNAHARVILRLILVTHFSQAMNKQAKEGNEEIITWTMSEFQANLPGVGIFSLNFYAR